MTTRLEPDLSGTRSWALKLANRSYTAPMIERAIMRDAAIVDLLQTRGFAKASTVAARIAARALARRQEHPADEWRSEVPAKVVMYRQVADANPGIGRSAPTDRRVLETFYLTAILATSTTFNLAVRLGGERGGMSERTWAESCRRLRHARVVEKVHGSAEGRRAAMYRLRAPRHETCTKEPGGTGSSVQERTLPLPIQPVARELLSHDSFRPRALGDAGWQVVRWLNPWEPIREAELSAATGISRERIRKVIGDLQAFRIAQKAASGWVRIEDDELLPLLDEVAVVKGTASALEKDVARHQRERRDYDEKHRMSRETDLSVQERDLVAEVVADRGEVLVGG